MRMKLKVNIITWFGIKQTREYWKEHFRDLNGNNSDMSQSVIWTDVLNVNVQENIVERRVICWVKNGKAVGALEDS